MRGHLALLLLGLLLGLLSRKVASDAAAPALIADVGLSGLVKAKDHFLPLVLASVRSLVIKGESSKNFDYDDIHISNANITAADVSFVANNGGINLTLAGLSLGTGTTNFEVKKKILFAHVHCSGHFSASISGTNVGVIMALKNVGGRPQIVANTSISFGKVSVSHHLNNVGCKIAESIVQLFIGNVNSKIESDIKSKVPAAVQSVLNTQVNALLAGLQLSVPVDKWSTANFSLAGATTNTATRLTLGFAARFEPTMRPAGGLPPTPTPPGSSPLLTPNCAEDLGLAFGAEIANSASVVYASAGALTVNSTLPPNVTSSPAFNALFPALIKHFPNSTFSVALAVRPKAPPTATITPPLLRLTASNVSVVFLASSEGGSPPIPALELAVGVNVSMDVNVTADGQFIQGKVLPGNGLRPIVIAVEGTQIGPVDGKALSAAVNLVIDTVALPYLNSHFKGVPIPQVAGITLAQPSVAAVGNEALVQTELLFAPNVSLVAGDGGGW